MKNRTDRSRLELTALLAALAAVLLGPGVYAGPAAADTLIPTHGRYSQTYEGDWSRLPTGKELARHDLSRYRLADVKGETAQRVFRDQKEVTLAHDRLRVSWQNPKCDKYRHALYYFANCEKVTIEDMVVVQADPDYRASSVFFFEDCGTVTIRNCCLGGTSGKSMIRIEGTERYLIDRVEIAGIDYPGVGVRSGSGIEINNGEGWDAQHKRPGVLYSEHPRELRWGVIQNCYIHDYPNVLPDTNDKGIALTSPADGLLFNCVFENYEADSALDISHRRDDPAYRNHLFRLERNVFRNCHRVKSSHRDPGWEIALPASCALLWANNLYVDSNLTDYHAGWKNRHVNETYVFTHGETYFCTMHCLPGGTLFRNCLLWAREGIKSMYEPFGLEGEDAHALEPDSFLYLMPAPGAWLRPRGKVGAPIAGWDAWRQAGFDPHSKLLQADPQFVDAQRQVYRLRPTSPAAGTGSPSTLKPEGMFPGVAWDFDKRPRPGTPSVGAFEVAAGSRVAAAMAAAGTGSRFSHAIADIAQK